MTQTRPRPAVGPVRVCGCSRRGSNQARRSTCVYSGNRESVPWAYGNRCDRGSGRRRRGVVDSRGRGARSPARPGAVAAGRRSRHRVRVDRRARKTDHRRRRDTAVRHRDHRPTPQRPVLHQSRAASQSGGRQEHESHVSRPHGRHADRSRVVPDHQAGGRARRSPDRFSRRRHRREPAALFVLEQDRPRRAGCHFTRHGARLRSRSPWKRVTPARWKQTMWRCW